MYSDDVREKCIARVQFGIFDGRFFVAGPFPLCQFCTHSGAQQYGFVADFNSLLLNGSPLKSFIVLVRRSD